MLEGNKYGAAAVIVAGGSGVRFNADTKKQYLKLSGRYILDLAVKAFDKSDSITEIIVTVPREDLDYVTSEVLPGNKFQKPLMIIHGGFTRQESVFNGLSAISDEVEFAAIHDGVRPLVKTELIDRVCERAFETGAALLAERSTLSTFTGENSRIGSYIDRKNLWLAQTPQAFNKSQILTAHEMALKDKYDASDDGMIYKKYIGDVEIVESSPENIKITYGHDLYIAETILKAGE